MLEVKDLRLGFNTARKMLLAVDGISFSVAAGETFALLGESGCGKSATAQGIMRLLPANGQITGGTVALHGEASTLIIVVFIKSDLSSRLTSQGNGRNSK